MSADDIRDEVIDVLRDNIQHSKSEIAKNIITGVLYILMSIIVVAECVMGIRTQPQLWHYLIIALVLYFGYSMTFDLYKQCRYHAFMLKVYEADIERHLKLEYGVYEEIESPYDE